MKAINLAILCLGRNLQNFCEYKNSMAECYKEKRVKKDEIETLMDFVKALSLKGLEMSDLDNFFYGFAIPQISKEFDLLKIYEDGPVVNIELKSNDIAMDKIEYQLRKNRYYLSHLKKKIYSFTYVNSGENGKIYSYDGDKLLESNIEEIAQLISLKGTFIKENIESLFKAKDYLISPINTPQLFVEGNYYLTGQQEEIKNKIINGIDNREHKIWGIQGSAGTGKTLLLYDIARTLGQMMRVCVIHSGILSQGHIELNSILREVDIIPVKECNENLIRQYDCILIDESQRLYQVDFDCIVKAFQDLNIHCIFGYDYYQVLSYAEENRNIPEQLNRLSFFCENKLSEKIRTNKEVASFIKNVINLAHRPKRYMDYSNIEVLYAFDYTVAKNIIEHYVTNKEYKFISYTPSRIKSNDIDKLSNYTNTHHIIGQEFDNVIFSMDNNFKYTEDGHLQGRIHPNPDYIFYKLWFQGVSRARERLCILIIGNEPLFNNILQVKMQFSE